MDVAITLLNAGADPNIKNKYEETPADVNFDVGFALMKIERNDSPDDTRSCENISDYSKIKSTICGQKSLCMAEISCKIKIGDSHVEKTYQAICSALANGDCPTANQCVLDRSFAAEEANGQTDNGAASSSSSSSKPSKGVR